MLLKDNALWNIYTIFSYNEILNDWLYDQKPIGSNQTNIWLLDT